MALGTHSYLSLPNRATPYPLLHPKPATTIRSQAPTTDSEPTNEPKKPTQPGLGFGPDSTSKKKQKGKRERAAVVRRDPVEKPVFVKSKEEEERANEVRKNEGAFLLAWLGLGGLILVEGILLAASGFLPEEWDGFVVKYLYPSFTPTVFLFIAGTVAYGVFKYLQNENLNNQK